MVRDVRFNDVMHIPLGQPHATLFTRHFLDFFVAEGLACETNAVCIAHCWMFGELHSMSCVYKESCAGASDQCTTLVTGTIHFEHSFTNNVELAQSQPKKAPQEVQQEVNFM